ncbi:hypothetical protein ABZ547_00180 [Streptomyces sparsogenes]|uniref:hypothetical protein n=1 Tax=Streptomyces sparsogenes TaxID=67365 RepID=UPI0033E633EB
MPDRASWLILLGFLAVLTLVLWGTARLIRSQGGPRRTCRRIVWEARMTRRAFAEPFRVLRRHRRWARILSGHLADPTASDRALAALDHADAVADDGCYALAVQLNPARDRVRVVLAGRDPGAPATPWQQATADPGEWTWSAPAASLDGPGHPDRLLLALGVDRRLPGVVLVDWSRGPAALAVEGDPHAARGVLQALAAQIDHLPDGPPVHVARGVHPRHHGPDLDTLLDTLGDDPPPGDAVAGPTVTPVVVCWSPAPDQAARLSELCAAGRLRALVGGRLPGACWTLHVEPGGRLLAPGLHLDLESAALPRAIARTIRRTPRRPAPATGVPVPGSATPATAEAGARAESPAGARTEARAEARTEADVAGDFAEPEPEPQPAAARPAPVPVPVPGPRAEPDLTEPDLTEPDFTEPDPAGPDPTEPDGGPGPARRPSAPAAEQATPARTAEPAEPDPGRADGSGNDGSGNDDDLAEPDPAAPPSRSGGISAASGPTNERTSSQP